MAEELDQARYHSSSKSRWESEEDLSCYTLLSSAFMHLAVLWCVHQMPANIRFITNKQTNKREIV